MQCIGMWSEGVCMWTPDVLVCHPDDLKPPPYGDIDSKQLQTGN